jgi:hypothetical protein
MKPITRMLFLLISGLGLLLPLLAAMPVLSAIDRHSYPTEAPAGLREVISPEFDIFYIKPGFQPGNYGRLMIAEPQVTMDDSWERKYSKELSARDLQRIEADATRTLREQFGEKLAAGNGYTIVKGTGESDGAQQSGGVLLLKPSMLDLQLNAPGSSTPAIKDEWIRSAGNATLYLDLYDGASGELLLRVIDRGEARDRLRFYEGNRAVNNMDLRLLIGRWAEALRKHLDSLNTGTA